MKVTVTGATGLIGRHLVRALAAHGDAVVALTRGAQSVPGAHTVRWDPEHQPMPAEASQGVDAIINLAGKGVADGRWDAKHRREILRSRIQVTQRCVDVLGSPTGARLLINGSAIGYYGSGDQPVNESTPVGTGFLADVCEQWEAEARKGEGRARVVVLRTGIVLARDGGALPQLLLPARLGLGGPLAGGRQWQSWIHIDDEIGIILHLLTHDVRGAVNAVAPSPVRQREFARQLGRVLRRPALMATPGFAMRLMLGDAAELATTGQRVVPTAITSAGYSFRFATLPRALGELLG